MQYRTLSLSPPLTLHTYTRTHKHTHTQHTHTHVTHTHTGDILAGAVELPTAGNWQLQDVNVLQGKDPDAATSDIDTHTHTHAVAPSTEHPLTTHSNEVENKSAKTATRVLIPKLNVIVKVETVRNVPAKHKANVAPKE